MSSRAGSRQEVLNEIIYFEAFVLPGEMRMMCASVFWGGSQGLGSFSTAAYKLPKAFLLLCYWRRIGGRLNKLGFEISDTCKKKKNPGEWKGPNSAKCSVPPLSSSLSFQGTKLLLSLGFVTDKSPNEISLQFVEVLSLSKRRGNCFFWSPSPQSLPWKWKKNPKHKDCIYHPKSSWCTTSLRLDLQGGLRHLIPMKPYGAVWHCPGRWKKLVLDPDLLVAGPGPPFWLPGSILQKTPEALKQFANFVGRICE